MSESVTDTWIPELADPSKAGPVTEEAKEYRAYEWAREQLARIKAEVEQWD